MGGSVHATSLSKISLTLRRQMMKPRKPVFRLPSIISFPLLSFNAITYWTVESMTFIHHSRFVRRIGALNPVPHGFRELSRSNAASKMRKNPTVAAHSENCGRWSSTSQYSSASATLALITWVARFTFIFCFRHWMWPFLRRLPSIRPSSSCNVLSSSMKRQSTRPPSPSYRMRRSPKVLRTSLIIWQASSSTFTRVVASAGCSNEGVNVDDEGEMSAPRSFSMLKWQAGPSQVTDATITPVECSRWRHSRMMLALSEPDMPSMRKYATGIFHEAFIDTAINTNASLAKGTESSYWLFPISTKPEYSPLMYSTCRLIAISSSINEQTVRLLLSASVLTCADRAVNAHRVNPGSPLNLAYHVRIWRGWGNASWKDWRTKLYAFAE